VYTDIQIDMIKSPETAPFAHNPPNFFFVKTTKHLLLLLAPDLELALWSALGALTGCLDRKLIIALVM